MKMKLGTTTDEVVAALETWDEHNSYGNMARELPVFVPTYFNATGTVHVVVDTN